MVRVYVEVTMLMLPALAVAAEGVLACAAAIFAVRGRGVPVPAVCGSSGDESGDEG